MKNTDNNSLTYEEFDSLLKLALGTPYFEPSGAHLTKLLDLGYVVRTDDGLRATGEALLCITERL